MSRLAKRFSALAERGRTALIPYITAGDPHGQATVTFMHSLAAAGADIIELGVPFTDPMADGPVIQAAHQRALAQDVSLADVLAIVTEFRRQDEATPVVLMGYLNPVDAMGVEQFAARAAEAGVDGALIVDVTPEEAPDVLPPLVEAGIEPVSLVAPTTGPDRIARISSHAGGFIYYVALKGVTGAGNLDTSDLERQVAPIRQVTDLPVGIGFGVRTPEDAAAVARVGDAVIAGSVLVKDIGEFGHDVNQASTRIRDTLAAMRQRMDDQTTEGQNA